MNLRSSLYVILYAVSCIIYTTSWVKSWYLYQVVTQNIMRKHEGKWIIAENKYPIESNAVNRSITEIVPYVRSYFCEGKQFFFEKKKNPIRVCCRSKQMPQTDQIISTLACLFLSYHLILVPGYHWYS